MVRPVIDFLEMMRQIKSVAVDHFAGDGDLLDAVKEYFPNHRAYDIDPDKGYIVNDSLEYIPAMEDEFPVFNPVWLAKNVAKRMDSKQYEYFEDERNKQYTDLYQIALDRVLNKYDFALAIIPETFITANIEWMLNRAFFISILEDNPFEDTEHPTCVVGFLKEVKDTVMYIGNKPIGYLSRLKKLHEKFLCEGKHTIIFNDQKGTIGLKAIDGTNNGDKIRFFLVSGSEYENIDIKESSRHITFISGQFKGKEAEIIDDANKMLDVYLKKTKGIFLSAFMGNNKDGKRRRRLSFKIARCILERNLK